MQGVSTVKITLRNFTIHDLEVYEAWRKEIGAHLYMSRFFPRAFDGENAEKPGYYAWYVIMADGVDVGVVWLEKDSPGDDEATLGIMIGLGSRIGIGIGTQAIRLAIEQAHMALGFKAVSLNVRKTNTRAIRCYEHCGFVVTGGGGKLAEGGAAVPFYKMKLTLA